MNNIGKVIGFFLGLTFIGAHLLHAGYVYNFQYISYGLLMVATISLGTIYDITKKFQEKLERSKNRLENHDRKVKQIFDNVKGSIWAYELKTKELFMSKGIESIFGFSKEKFINEPDFWKEVVHPEDRDKTKNSLKELKSGKDIYREFRIITKKGEFRWVNDIITPIVDNNNRLTHLVGIIIDVTKNKRNEQQLKNSEDRYKSFIDDLLYPVYISSMDFKLVYANEEGLNVLGAKSMEEIKEKSLYDFIHSDYHQSSRKRLEHIKEFKSLNVIEYKINRLDQEIVEVESRIGLTKYNGEDAIVVVGRDVTERKTMERALKESEQKYKNLVEEALVGIYIYQKNKVVYLNPRLQKMIGYEKQELNEKNLFNIVMKDELLESLKNNINNHRIHQELRIKNKNGEIVFVEIQTSPTIFNGEHAVIGTVLDITEKKLNEEKINKMAYYDALTELPNRNMLTNNLKKYIARADRNNSHLAVMFIDLDRFKLVNDTYGHSFGDLMLKTVADRLNECIREYDMISRIGGDEFIILLDGIDKEEASKAANRMLEEFKKPITIQGHDIYTSPSIGISLFPEDSKDGEDLIKYADAAMYLSKETGKNTYSFYSKEINEKQMRRLDLEGQLRKAIENDQFIVYYQPQINFSTGKIIGLEALLRWEHPTLGIIMPSEIIPLAKEIGFMCRIEEWVIKNTIQQIKKWQNQHFHFGKVAINLSSLEYKEVKIVDIIEELVNNANIDPSYLEFELEERLLIESKQSKNILKQLKNIGVSISIDNFGKDYKILNLLKELSIDRMKIDKSFIQDINTNPNSLAIVKSLLEFGKNSNFHVLAEGIEQKEQVDYLESIECTVGQGYYFSIPLPEEELYKKFGVGLYS